MSPITLDPDEAPVSIPGEGPTVVPFDGEIADPEADFEGLLTVFDPAAQDIRVVDSGKVGKSWAFDFLRSRFIPRRSGPLRTNGLTSLRYWIEKCLRSERGAAAVWPDEYGTVGTSDFYGQVWRTEYSVLLEERVAEALSFHPRISRIENFTVKYDRGSTIVQVSFHVVLAEEADRTAPDPGSIFFETQFEVAGA